MPEKFTIALCAIMAAFLLATNVHAATASSASSAFSISVTGGGYSGDITGTSAVTGVKLGYEIIGKNISDSLGLEAGFSAASSQSSGNNNGQNLYLYRLDAIYPFQPRNRLVPYLAVGVGGCSGCNGTTASNSLLGNYGIGIRYFLTENIAVRTDFRQLIIYDGNNISDKSNNFEYTAGLTYYLSNDKQLVRIPIIDSDHDGVPDDRDACPNTRRGVKVDAVGCPLDSDKDGVPDYLDKCPDTPSGTKVGADGCPLVPTAPKPAEAVKETLPEMATRVITPEKTGAPPATVAATGALPAAVGAESPVTVPDSGKASIYTKKDLPIEQKPGIARITGDAALPAPPAEPMKPGMAAAQQPQVPEKPSVGPRPEVTTKATNPEKPGAPPATVAATGTVPAAVGAESPVSVPDSMKASIYTKKEMPIEQETTAARISGDGTLPATPAATLKTTMPPVQRPQAPKKPAVCPTLPDMNLVASYAGCEQVIVEFNSNSAALQRKYLSALKTLRKRLKENSSLKVIIEGHADYRGSPAYNLALSRRRAIAVKSYLIRDMGVVATNITIKAFGCTIPIDDNRTFKGRQKNRRTVVLTIKDTQ